MNDGKSRTFLPLVLLAQGGSGEHDWLIELLTASRYAVIAAEGDSSVRVRAGAAQPDLIILSAGEHGEGLALARGLRADGQLDPSTPILLILPRAVTRSDRLDAIRAGAWDVIAPPYDAELLIQQIGLFVGARLDATRAQSDGLIDHATMLYNRVGLARRARELGALAYRDHTAIGCLAIVIDALPAPTAEASADQRLVVTRSVHALRAATRQSDAVGRIGATEFAVVAPGADADGCRRLARRVGATLDVKVRGGYDAVFNAGYAPFAPVDLLVRASTAVRTGEVEREVEWLRRYTEVMRP